MYIFNRVCRFVNQEQDTPLYWNFSWLDSMFIARSCDDFRSYLKPKNSNFQLFSLILIRMWEEIVSNIPQSYAITLLFKELAVKTPTPWIPNSWPVDEIILTHPFCISWLFYGGVGDDATAALQLGQGSALNRGSLALDYFVLHWWKHWHIDCQLVDLNIP